MLKHRWTAALALAVGLGAAASGPAMAKAVHPTATFGIFAGTSTPMGIHPTHVGNDDFFKYSYTITNGGSLSDTIPFLVCLDADTPGDDGSGNPVPWTDQVAVDNPSGGFSGSVSPSGSPWSFSSSDSTIATNPPAANDPACRSDTITIDIPAGTLMGSPGTGFTTNVQFKTQNRNPSTGNTSLNDTIGDPEKKIQIFVQIVAGPAFTCYLTDSEGNFLIKDDGTPGNGIDAGVPANASGETDGTYTIVTNPRGVAVATNSGQFYYNLLWTNTGSDPATVAVSLTSTNLVPNGTQALHWLTDDGLTLANFDDVIEGNPAGAGTVDNPPTGATGTVPTTGTISVPSGSTLFVTWHLEWAYLGQRTFPTLPQLTVAGTVNGVDTCTAGAVVK